MEGNGTMITAWGARYEGSWMQGKMHGHGHMMFPTADSYVGEWDSGRRSGAPSSPPSPHPPGRGSVDPPTLSPSLSPRAGAIREKGPMSLGYWDQQCY